MDEAHLLAALRYVALNPVRARLVGRAGDFAAFLSEAFDDAMGYAALCKAESVGRPVGSADWIADMEARSGLKIAPAKRGPAPRGMG